MPTKRSSSNAKGLSYAEAGVNISIADAAKKTMAKTLRTNDKRVLNSVGAFASVVEGVFPGIKHPVLVLKTEEPGSKQLLAFQYGRIESICQDMIHHLINDIAVMGATPVYVQDAVICGRLEKGTVTRIVAGIAAACRAHGCTLTGGETSEQPGMLEAERYILTSSIVGVAEKGEVIDGSAIKKGDTILAVASNGLHTNGYTLVRALLTRSPALLKQKVGKLSFLNAILLPHVCYFNGIKDLFRDSALHGMAHITGGGIQGNLNRILPPSLDAKVDLSKLRILPIFHAIREAGSVTDAEMLRTYNMGAGLTIVVDSANAKRIAKHLIASGYDTYEIGEIVSGKGKVSFMGELQWK